MSKMPAKVKPYVGMNPRIDDPWVRIGYERSRDATTAYYVKPTDADVRVFDGQVVLNEVTAPYLYSKFTSTKMKVERGTYPKLDRIVDMLIGDGRYLTDRMKVLKLMLWCRDIPVRGRETKAQTAGGHEELIAVGGTDTCNEMNRVFMVMCQIAGFASRYVGHFASFLPDEKLTFQLGHGVAEVFVEGRWAYFDIRGKHFVWPDNTLCSHWDLVRCPELYVRQPESVRMLRDLRRNNWDSSQYLVQWPSLQVISNYDAAVRATCTYTPVTQTSAQRRRFETWSRKRTQQSRVELKKLLRDGYEPPAVL
jgi:hypothetical protein